MNDVLDQQRNGVSLGNCAEIFHHLSELKAQHGEPGFQPHFHQFLRGRGLTEATWWGAYDVWRKEMEAQPGLAAKYHTYYSNYANSQRIAAQPNVSGHTLGGLSLEAYAKISAQSQTGAAIEGLVAGEGLTMAQWLEGQAAWGAKMGSVSPTDPIILQYGQLYQKWAPNHQAAMEASTERILSDEADRSGKGGGMSEALTMDTANQFFDHGDIRVRARGVREMVRIYDLNSSDRNDRMRGLTKRAYDEALKILNEGPGANFPGLLAFGGNVNEVDIHTWSKMANEEEMHQGTADLVIQPLKDLAYESFLTPAQNDAAQNAIRAAGARLQPRAAKVDELFSVVGDELKQVQLRSLKDSYRELFSDMQEALEDWDYNAPEAAEDSSASFASASHASAGNGVAGNASSGAAFNNTALTKPAAPENEILAMLKKLPIIGQILKMLGL